MKPTRPFFPTLWLASIAVVHLSTTAGAEQSSSAEHQRCIAESGGVTVQMLDCLGAELERKDAELNDLWAKVPAAIGSDAMTPVRKAQRAWIAFRDAQCEAASSLTGDGSLSAIAYSSCVLEMTEDRVSELRRMLEPAGEASN